MTLVSVVIPTLNEARQIHETIRETRRLGADEIIVVDGGSRDETLTNAVAADAVIVSAAGRAIQQNAGALACRGDVLVFLHADSRLGEGAIDAARERMSESSDVGGCFRQQIDAEGWIYRVVEWGNHQRAKWLGRAYGDQGIFVRRETFTAIGGFPEVKLLEDVLLVKQLRKRGRFRPLPHRIHTSARRWQQVGVVRQTLRNWTILFLARLGVSPDWLAARYPPVR